MIGITLEKMQISQLERMSALARKIFKEHYDPIVGAETNDYMIEKYQSASGIANEVECGAQYFFVRHNGQDIGIVATDVKSKYMYLSKFYLAKEFRGHGYSREMMNFVENQAIENGLNRIRLNVNAGNFNTIETYRHFGFEIVEELQKDVGGGYSVHDYVMERKLSKA
ncbi:MAG: GNAT family N-acetyltransferase [Clostridia bacterium]|nr:GNAT family N-acetyltransferase [Clostridia bacterium]